MRKVQLRWEFWVLTYLSALNHYNSTHLGTEHWCGHRNEVYIDALYNHPRCDQLVTYMFNCSWKTCSLYQICIRYNTVIKNVNQNHSVVSILTLTVVVVFYTVNFPLLFKKHRTHEQSAVTGVLLRLENLGCCSRSCIINIDIWHC